jgi:hypothetical protein
MTVIGIMGAFVFATGGWLATNALLDMRAQGLLSQTRVVEMPQQDEATDGVAVNQDEAGQSTGLPAAALPSWRRVTLDQGAIAHILISWETSRTLQEPRLHEPVAGQLSLERAVEVTRDGLRYLSDQGALLAELREEDMIVKAMTLYTTLQAEGSPSRILPEYSYWDILLAQGEWEAQVRVNAVTGEIWYLTLFSSSPGGPVTSLGIEDLLDAYLSYLGLRGEGQAAVQDDFGSRAVEGGLLYATVLCVPTGERGVRGTGLVLSLVAVESTIGYDN